MERQRNYPEIKISRSFFEWMDEVDAFLLEQARLKSKVRIQEGKVKPIDLLACYISSDNRFAVNMQEPYNFINGLKTAALEELQEDMKIYIKFERGKNLDYWKAIQYIVAYKIKRNLRLI